MFRDVRNLWLVISLFTSATAAHSWKMPWPASFQRHTDWSPVVMPLPAAANRLFEHVQLTESSVSGRMCWKSHESIRCHIHRFFFSRGGGAVDNCTLCVSDMATPKTDADTTQWRKSETPLVDLACSHAHTYHHSRWLPLISNCRHSCDLCRMCINLLPRSGNIDNIEIICMS